MTPELVVCPSPSAVSERAAALVAQVAQQAIARSGRFTLALSGGATPRVLYQALASAPYIGAIDWSATHLFWSDERCVPPDRPDSNYRMAKEALLDRAPIPPGNIHRMRGEAPVPQQAAQEYTAELQAVFGRQGPPRFDLLLLGLGDDGHTASLFPGVHVPDDPAIPVAAVYVPKAAMWRLTFTLPTLNAAAQVLFLVTGEGKRAPLRALIAGPPSLNLPSQHVQPTNGALTVIADAAAAGDLAASS